MADEAPVEVVEQAGGTRVVLRGRVGVEHAAGVHRAARDALGRPGDVTVACEAEYVHAAAVQVLYALRREAAAAGRAWAVTGPGPGAEFFRLAGLDAAAGGSGNGG